MADSDTSIEAFGAYYYEELQYQDSLVLYSGKPWQDHARLSRWVTTWLDEEDRVIDELQDVLA